MHAPSTKCVRRVLAVSLAFTAPLAAQGHTPSAELRPGASVPAAASLLLHAPKSTSLPGARGAASPELLMPLSLAPEDGARLPRWARWGLVGAAAGAVTFPLLGSLASDDEGTPARDAVAGAVVGFVLVGGSVALWDVVCGGNTRSRRAGLCGRG